MFKDWQIGGLILGKFNRAQKRRLGTVLTRHSCDLRVVGRDNDTGDELRLPGSSNAPRNQREPGKVFDILAWDAFRAAARRDEGENVGHNEFP
jgi:hypothetical protein